MSFDFPLERREPLTPIILVFLREVTLILDETTPLPRRRALLEKWWHVFAGLGAVSEKPPEEFDSLSSRELREHASQLLKALQGLVAATRRP